MLHSFVRQVYHFFNNNTRRKSNNLILYSFVKNKYNQLIDITKRNTKEGWFVLIANIKGIGKKKVYIAISKM